MLFRQLEYFVAVARERHFARAADACYVSQPALSRQIRGLEQVVGCQLLKRSTHQVELTVAGEALLERSRKVLHDVDEAVSAALAPGRGSAISTANLPSTAASAARR